MYEQLVSPVTATLALLCRPVAVVIMHQPADDLDHLLCKYTVSIERARIRKSSIDVGHRNYEHFGLFIGTGECFFRWWATVLNHAFHCCHTVFVPCLPVIFCHSRLVFCRHFFHHTKYLQDSTLVSKAANFISCFNFSVEPTVFFLQSE